MRDRVDDMTEMQERIAHELLLVGQPFPPFSSETGQEIRGMIERQLEDVVSDPLVLTKSALTAVHQCEGLWASENPEFTWTFELVAGILAHIAIQHQHQDQYEREPHYYVETATEAARIESPIAEWLETASPALLLEISQRATTHMQVWTDHWPQLRREWRIRGEMRLSANLLGGRLSLIARPDFVIGPPPSATSARQALIDVKTSDRLYAESREEAWFYALVYLLRVGTAPHSSIVYSMPSGEWHADYRITPEHLSAAARRVIAGAKKMVEVTEGRNPTLTPSPNTYCRWCPRRDTCPAYEEATRRQGSNASL